MNKPRLWPILGPCLLLLVLLTPMAPDRAEWLGLLVVLALGSMLAFQIYTT